jgi:hypothetical protein
VVHSRLNSQGLANPAASVSKFIALLCDPSAKIREASMAAVTGIRDRYPGFIVEHSLSGVVQCYSFLQRAFGQAGVDAAYVVPVLFCPFIFVRFFT